MWLVDPQVMCRKHLLGEHVEMHMLVGTIARGKSLAGYVAKGLIDTTQIQSRHDALAQEMLARGYKHKSPLVVPPVEAMGHVDSLASIKELARRCELCASRQNGVIDPRDRGVQILDDWQPSFLLERIEKREKEDAERRRQGLPLLEFRFD